MRKSAHPKNPSSWNRYSYTAGDPVNHNDPGGMDFYWGVDGDDGGGGGGGDGDGGYGDGGYSNCVWNPAACSPWGSGPTSTQNGGGGNGQGSTFAAGQQAFQYAANSIAGANFTPTCDADFTAVGKATGGANVDVSAETITAAAGSATFLNANGSTTAMQSLYASSPVQGVQQAGNLVTGTVGSFVASNPGTVAVAQMGGSAIYINSIYINPASVTQNLGIVLHELLHNVSGLTDGDIQDALGIEQTNVTDNITQKLIADCFSGAP